MSARLPFGKFKGRPIDEIESNYLQWLADRDNLWEPLKGAITAELARRDRDAPADEPRGNGQTNPGRESDAQLAEQIISAGLRSLAAQLRGNPEKMVRINNCAQLLRQQVRSWSR